MKSIRVLLAALILQAPALSFAHQIVATFEGNFELRSFQRAGGEPLENEVTIPFTSTVSIFTDHPQLYVDADSNSAETSFGGSSFSTQLTNALLNEHALSIAPSINYSYSVYSPGDQPARAWNDLSLLAISDVNDDVQNEYWLYMLMIRGNIGVPGGDDHEQHQDDERDPMSGQALLEGLTFAMNAGQSFDVTEFYTAYSSEGDGALKDFDWYTTGSARLVSVSSVAAVPEPSTFALMLLGLAASGFAVRRRQGAES
jgi:hypothetical protein